MQGRSFLHEKLPSASGPLPAQLGLCRCSRIRGGSCASSSLPEVPWLALFCSAPSDMVSWKPGSAALFVGAQGLRGMGWRMSS